MIILKRSCLVLAILVQSCAPEEGFSDSDVSGEEGQVEHHVASLATATSGFATIAASPATTNALGIDRWILWISEGNSANDPTNQGSQAHGGQPFQYYVDGTPRHSTSNFRLPTEYGLAVPGVVIQGFLGSQLRHTYSYSYEQAPGSRTVTSEWDGWVQWRLIENGNPIQRQISFDEPGGIAKQDLFKIAIPLLKADLDNHDFGYSCSSDLAKAVSNTLQCAAASFGCATANEPWNVPLCLAAANACLGMLDSSSQAKATCFDPDFADPFAGVCGNEGKKCKNSLDCTTNGSSYIWLCDPDRSRCSFPCNPAYWQPIPTCTGVGQTPNPNTHCVLPGTSYTRQQRSNWCYAGPVITETCVNELNCCGF